MAIFFLWLFASAGVSKLRPANLPYYITVFSSFGISDQNTTQLAIRAVGLSEVVLGLLIALPASRSFAVYGAILMLVLYGSFLAFQMAQGRSGIDCGCSGPGGAVKVSGHLLVRNALLAFGTLVCLNASLSATDSAGLAYWSIMVCFAALLILLYASAEQLISNAQKLSALK